MSYYSLPDDNDTKKSKALGFKPDIFNSRGRLGRLRFITYSLLIFTLWAAISAISNVLWQLYYNEWHDALSLMMIFISIFASIMGIIFCIRRLNDFNSSGWWMLIFLAVLPIMLLIMIFRPGTRGENRFGTVAIKNTTWIYVTLCSLLILLLLASIL